MGMQPALGGLQNQTASNMTDYTTEAGFYAALERCRIRESEELRAAEQAMADAEAARRAKAADTACEAMRLLRTYP